MERQRPGTLRNTIERIILLEEGDTLLREHLDFLRPAQTSRDISSNELHDPSAFTLPPEGIVLDDVNQDLILQALALTGGNQVVRPNSSA
jgi:DNA-binding NtrC family response regulator